jgi:hypothetical protein
MYLPWGSAPTFSRSVPFPNNCGSIRMNGDAYFGRVDGKEGTAVLPCQHTTIYGLTTPGIEAENPIGF